MNTDIQIQNRKAMVKAYQVARPLYQRLGFLAFVTYALTIVIAPMPTTFDYFRAAAMVAGALNVIMTGVVVYAYWVTRSNRVTILLPTHVLHIGIGYILLVLASMNIMIDHWGDPVSLPGSPLTLLAYLFGFYGLSLMMFYQFVAEVREEQTRREQ